MDIDSIIEKITPYQIGTNLIPGVIFTTLVSEFGGKPYRSDDVVILLFQAYLIGMAINRVGSIGIEPLLKITRIVKFSKYEDYVAAAKLDPKIEILSETNNTFRSIISSLTCIILIEVANAAVAKCYITTAGFKIAAFALGLLVFVYSYRKQTSYIGKRVQIQIAKKDN